MNVAEFFEAAKDAGLRGPAIIETRKWPGTSGEGTFELSMRNGENDMFLAGEFGYRQVSLSFRPAYTDDSGRFRFNALCQGRKFWIE